MTDKEAKNKYSILIVDDEKNIQEMLMRYFRFLGYSVDSASNGREALDMLAKKKYDIVISDIMMPVMDGTQLLREIRNQYPMIHCIMITGYVTLENVLTCMRLGADYCVFKPLEDLKELEACVKDAIKQLEHWTSKLKTLRNLKS